MTDVDVWGERARENINAPVPHGWLDVEWLLRDRVWPKLFGFAPGGWWTPDLFQSIDVPVGGDWLSLGCGSGVAEVSLARDGAAGRITGLDPSPGAIAVAQNVARDAGVADRATFAVTSGELPVFQANSVDVVHMNMSLHHVENLEWTFAQIFTALRPGGYFIANEFVGPERFQWSSKRIGEVTDFLASIPDRLRRDYRDNSLKTHQETHPADWWVKNDPTESVRSRAILPLLSVIDPGLQVRPYGGNIANLVLENIIHNFNLNNPEDRACMDRLWAEDEKSVAAEGSDFVYIIASKSRSWRQMATAWESAAKWLASRDILPS